MRDVALFDFELAPASDFNDFWKLYPRRVAKLAAARAWSRLSASEKSTALAALPAHIEDWSTRDLDKIPHPATWLNGHRFDDELVPRHSRQISDHEFFRINGYSRQTAERWAMERES